jgi:L-lactate dehydrogenase complex protein LldG
MVVTGADFAIAETGTLGIIARPAQPRLLSSLPAVHVAVVRRSQLVPTLMDLVPTLRETAPQVSNIALITGPSRTGDIEQTLTIGAHGPRAVQVIFVPD